METVDKVILGGFAPSNPKYVYQIVEQSTKWPHGHMNINSASIIQNYMSCDVSKCVIEIYTHPWTYPPTYCFQSVKPEDLNYDCKEREFVPSRIIDQATHLRVSEFIIDMWNKFEAGVAIKEKEIH
jgi:hypothetical protein